MTHKQTHSMNNAILTDEFDKLESFNITIHIKQQNMMSWYVTHVNLSIEISNAKLAWWELTCQSVMNRRSNHNHRRSVWINLKCEQIFTFLTNLSSSAPYMSGSSCSKNSHRHWTGSTSSDPSLESTRSASHAIDCDVPWNLWIFFCWYPENRPKKKTWRFQMYKIQSEINFWLFKICQNLSWTAPTLSGNSTLWENVPGHVLRLD